MGQVFGLSEIDRDIDQGKVLTLEIDREIDRGRLLAPKIDCEIDQYKVLGPEVRFWETSRNMNKRAKEGGKSRNPILHTRISFVCPSLSSVKLRVAPMNCETSWT